MNITNIQMSSMTTSLKILSEGTGTLIVPSTATSTSVTNTIFHNYGGANLLWQVQFNLTFTGGGSPLPGLMTPYSSADGQTVVVATIDSNNLYITGKAQTAGTPTLPYQAAYFYRILVP